MTNSEAVALLRPVYDALGVALAALGQAPATTPPPTTTPPPPVVEPPAPVAATRYQASRITLADAMFLRKMTSPYSSVLRNLPGSHQLFFDVLTNNKGQTYWELPEGSAAQMDLKVAVNRWINDAAYAAEYPTFDVKTYTGPLKAIYDNIVAAKLAGKAT